MSNFDGDDDFLDSDDDFLTLRLGQPSSSSSPSPSRSPSQSQRSSAVVNYVTVPPDSPPPAQTLVAPQLSQTLLPPEPLRTPTAQHEQQLPTNLDMFPWDFDILFHMPMPVSYLQQQYPLPQQLAVSSSLTEPMLVQIDQQPPTQDQNPPPPADPVQPLRLQINIQPPTQDQNPPPPADPVQPLRLQINQQPLTPNQNPPPQVGLVMPPRLQINQQTQTPDQNPPPPAGPVQPSLVQINQQTPTPDQNPPHSAGPVQSSEDQSNHPKVKTESVPPPFPWATSRRATVHSISHLLSNQITQITGDVQCKTCNRKYLMIYELKKKFKELANFIMNNMGNFHDRAPAAWTNPSLPDCKYCGQEGCVRPLMGDKKKSINWLFLLLGQLLGCCTLGHLRYFCKHTRNHRTGAKDRLLYLTYRELCNQLSPNELFSNRALR